MIDIEQIIQKYRQYRNSDKDIAMIQKAYVMAREAHTGQYRKSKEPYIVHPLSVAFTLTQFGMDWESICAALLHDTMEDTNLDPNTLLDRFGAGVFSIVEALTKIKETGLAMAQKEARQLAKIESIRKIILGMTTDPRVIFIKLADRWDNIKTLHHLDPLKRKEIAEETLAIYAPMADRLGLHIIKTELEDISFRHLKPKQHQKFNKQVTISRSFLQNDIQEIKSRIAARFAELGWGIEMYEHYLTPYELHKQSQQKLRVSPLIIHIIPPSPLHCYTTLGIIHELFTPLPGSTIKDFIAVPQSNGYQGLHSVVLFKEHVYPVQIRTREMDQIAQYGIIKKVDGFSGEQYQYWLNTVKELLHDKADTHNFFKFVKEITKGDQIYVCTPNGDYWGFPANAIILDFAYRIHTEIGHHCAGALMDNHPAEIYEELKDGAIVEIITSPDVSPKTEWLNHVRTPKSRSAIQYWLEAKKRIRSREFGQKKLRMEMERYNLSEDLIESDEMRKILQEMGSPDLDDLYSKIGMGMLTCRKILSHFVSLKAFQKYPARSSRLWPRWIQSFFNSNDKEQVYEIRDIHDVFIKLSKCCNPLPGDAVVGNLSRSYGLSIHKTDCPIYRARPEDKDRVVRLSWALEKSELQPFRVVIRGDKKSNILVAVIQLFKDRKIALNHITATLMTQNEVTIELELEAISAEQADLLLRLIKRLRGVQRVQRL